MSAFNGRNNNAAGQYAMGNVSGSLAGGAAGANYGPYGALIGAMGGSLVGMAGVYQKQQNERRAMQAYKAQHTQQQGMDRGIAMKNMGPGGAAAGQEIQGQQGVYQQQGQYRNQMNQQDNGQNMQGLQQLMQLLALYQQRQQPQGTGMGYGTQGAQNKGGYGNMTGNYYGS